jgi:hypothetical protein
MGALLLPRRLVEVALAELLAPRGTRGERILLELHREDAARLLTETFDVNPVVARIRLANLYPEGRRDQLTVQFLLSCLEPTVTWSTTAGDLEASWPS